MIARAVEELRVDVCGAQGLGSMILHERAVDWRWPSTTHCLREPSRKMPLEVNFPTFQLIARFC